MSEKKNLSKEDIINTHSNKDYTVYFIGFLPGFLYLGGLDKKLYFPRKSNPNLMVKKGSVGIGGYQTGVYPGDSPGGWNIIGSIPINFFDPKMEKPCFAKPGDKIRFYPISLLDYDKIDLMVKKGDFIFEKELLDD